MTALLLNNSAPQEEMTLIITGAGRCGTSMAAAVLHSLGFNLGRVEAPVYEDSDMNFALRHFYHEARYKVIAHRNANLAKWGFKVPGIQNHMQPPEIVAHFRKPRVIIMQRDNAALAIRLLKSDGYKNVISALRHASRQQDKLIEFAEFINCPTAILSYEKFIQSPRAYVEFLTVFCGLRTTEDELQKAVDIVLPNNPDYASAFA
jgi:hypothetical protein